MSSPNLRLLPGDAPRPGGGAPDPDEALVARATAGDMAAWAKLYERHFAGVLRHICFLSGDASIGEDLAQEVFARALAGLDRFGQRSAFSTWVHGIAVNTVRKHRESQARAVRVRERAARIAAITGPDDDLDRRSLQQARVQVLYQILDRLPLHLREAFVLRDLLGVPVREAAAQLDVTEENVRVRAHRARARVHDELVAAGWIDASPKEDR